MKCDSLIIEPRSRGSGSNILLCWMKVSFGKKKYRRVCVHTMLRTFKRKFRQLGSLKQQSSPMPRQNVTIIKVTHKIEQLHHIWKWYKHIVVFTGAPELMYSDEILVWYIGADKYTWDIRVQDILIKEKKTKLNASLDSGCSLLFDLQDWLLGSIQVDK